MGKETKTPISSFDNSEYWRKRKQNLLWCRLALNYDSLRELLSSGQFGLDNFCKFLFNSDKKAEIAKSIISLVKVEDGVFFNDLVERLPFPRSTLWQVYLMLKRAGVISRKTKAQPIKMSTKVSEVLEDLEIWWKNFVRVK